MDFSEGDAPDPHKSAPVLGSRHQFPLGSPAFPLFHRLSSIALRSPEVWCGICSRITACYKLSFLIYCNYFTKRPVVKQNGAICCFSSHHNSRARQHAGISTFLLLTTAAVCSKTNTRHPLEWGHKTTSWRSCVDGAVSHVLRTSLWVQMRLGQRSRPQLKTLEKLFVVRHPIGSLMRGFQHYVSVPP